MAAIPAHLTTVSVGGASASFSNQATTKLTANTVYQITAAADQRVDPTVDVTVQVDADGAGAGGYVTADPSTYTFDYLSGKVTFASDQGSSATVRVSGNFITVYQVGEAKDCSITLTNDFVDDNVFGDTFKTRSLTYQDCSGEISGFQSSLVDLDTGGGTFLLDTYLGNGGNVLLEVTTTNGPLFRAWVKLEEFSHKLTPGQLYEGSIKFRASAIKGSNQTEYVAFGYVS
jgi:hypothetical protein